MINLSKYKFFIKIFIINIAFCNSLYSQRSSWQKLSKPEKIWVLKHPFVAYKAFTTTQKVVLTLKDNSLITRLDSFSNGGKLDAFRHIYWMASLTKKIGQRKALQLGNAHEKGNYLQFKNGTIEDGILPDYASSKMDSLNNIIGATIGFFWRKSGTLENVEEIVKYINNGTAYIIKRNKYGMFIDCDNNLINPNPLRLEWKNKKCVVMIYQIK
jgi:hypothetical protein